ncbi:hypothetical protein V9T40_005180 [Parthenolecanium corni]|uniref:SET domain-containing protein n=1 Tax=Parthenolecanium corni TaxID=536013 RepID=A0AAN9TRM1_9HEMI
MDLFPPSNFSDIRCYQENVRVTYNEEDYLTAIRSCTLVIQASKANTMEARNAYSSRAVSLFQLEQYQESLFDANRSLREHWAKEGKVINIFKSRCLDKLLDEKFKAFPKCRQINVDALDPNYEENFELPKIEDPHEWIPNASKKIQIRFSSKYGRHLIAAEDISPGELLFVDKPYAYVQGNKCQITNCSHCFIRCISLISCPNCKTLFCSDSCRAQAFVQYHRIECQIMNNLKSKIFDMESKLALRMLMIATRQGKDLKKLSEHPVYQIPFNPSIRSVNKRHFQEDYYHIHHLESHERNLKNFDLIHFCYKAAILIDLLRWTTFFERTRDFTEEPHSLTREQLFVSSLLFKYLTLIRFNGIMIRDRVERPENLQKGAYFFDVFQTGLAIYPISSLLNHSCNSNSLTVSFKTSCACYATQPILKGQQIFINYECHYLIHSLGYRIKFLEDYYYFKCECRPCMEKWPGMNSKSKLQKISARLSNEEMNLYKNRMEQLVALQNIKDRYKSEHMHFLRDLLTKFYSATKHPNVPYENAMPWNCLPSRNRLRWQSSQAPKRAAMGGSRPQNLGTPPSVGYYLRARADHRAPE